MMSFSFEAWVVRFKLSSEEEIANISAPGPQIKKLRTLCFLQLEKLKKRKCPYFCDLWPRSRDMMTSSFEARVVRFKLSSEEEIDNILAPGPKIKKERTLCFLKL